MGFELWLQCVQKCVSDCSNSVIFEVFRLKFSAKKSIFQNRFFGRKYHSDNRKKYQIEPVGYTFLNSLYKYKRLSGKEKNTASLESFDRRTNPDFIIGTEYKDLIEDLSEDLVEGEIDFPGLVCDVFIHALETTVRSKILFRLRNLVIFEVF